MDEGDRALAMISTACLLVVLIFSVGHHVGWGRGQAFGTRESRIEAIKAGAGERVYRDWENRVPVEGDEMSDISEESLLLNCVTITLLLITMAINLATLKNLEKAKIELQKAVIEAKEVSK